MEKRYINKKYNGHFLYRLIDQNNPLNLPPNTMRVRTNDGEPPIKGGLTTYETATLVPGTTGEYDVYKSGTNFRQLLYESYNVVEVLGANTTNISAMNNMFRNCSALTTIQLFDTSNVKDMTFMFQLCNSLSSVPQFDTSKVTSMAAMFDRCSSITSAPLLDTSNVTTMDALFNSCNSLTTVPFYDTSKVTNMHQMFNGCNSLTSVHLYNTSKVTSMVAMFQGCSNLTYLPLFDTSKVTDMSYAFNGCGMVESGALALYQQASTQTTPPTYHDDTFNDCGNNSETGRVELAQIPASWGGLA